MGETIDPQTHPAFVPTSRKDLLKVLEQNWYGKKRFEPKIENKVKSKKQEKK